MVRAERPVRQSMIGKGRLGQGVVGCAMLCLGTLRHGLVRSGCEGLG